MSTHFSFSNADTCKKIVDILTEVLDSAVIFLCKENEIIVTGIDPNRISLLEIRFKKDELLTYHWTNNTRFSVYVKSLHTILRTVNRNDMILFSMTEDEDTAETLHITTDNTSCKKTFSLNLLLDESELVDMTDLDYTTIFTMSSKLFHEVCTNIKTIDGEIGKFTNERKSVQIQTDSDICSSFIVELKSEQTESKEQNETIVVHEDDGKEDLDIIIPIAYLNIYSKMHALADKVKIYMCNEIPMRLHFPFQEGVADFYISARFNDQD